MIRQDGTKIRFGRNACALVNNKNEPLGNRIPYFVMREIKYVNQKVYSIGKGGIWSLAIKSKMPKKMTLHAAPLVAMLVVWVVWLVVYRELLS